MCAQPPPLPLPKIDRFGPHAKRLSTRRATKNCLRTCCTHTHSEASTPAAGHLQHPAERGRATTPRVGRSGLTQSFTRNPLERRGRARPRRARRVAMKPFSPTDTSTSHPRPVAARRNMPGARLGAASRAVDRGASGDSGSALAPATRCLSTARVP